MAIAPKVMFRGTPGFFDSMFGSWQYQTIDVPTGKTWIVTNVIVTNTGTNAYGLSITANSVPMLGSGQYNSGELTAGSTSIFDIKQVLEAGQPLSIAAGYGFNDVFVHVSGVEVS